MRGATRKRIGSIFKIRSRIIAFTNEFFSKERFIAINTPKLTKSGVESGAEEFKMEYFGKKASLAQSPQVYKQMFVMAGLERVYEIGTIFRAEKSRTTRHLTEFVGIDMEMGFITDEHDVMDVVERFCQYITHRVAEECKEELAALDVSVPTPQKIPRMTIQEIRTILAKQGKIVPEDEDLDAEGERLLGEHVLAQGREHGVARLSPRGRRRAQCSGTSRRTRAPRRP